MVKSSAILTALIAALAVPAPSVRADDILDLIQNQVAGIVARSTSGIVTIEDKRGITLSDSWRQSMTSRPRGLRHQVTDALMRLSDIDIQIAVAKGTSKNSPVLADALKLRTATSNELNLLKTEIAKSSDSSRLNFDIYSIFLAALTDKRNHLETEISQLSQTYKPNSSKVYPLIATKSFLSVEIAETATLVNTLKQSVDADASLRTDIPKAGTGFSIGDGFIVTTADVLDGMYEPIVITTDGARIRTKIVGLDNETNIGVLHISSNAELPKLVFANSDQVAVGHFAISIGNQFGNQNVVALNTISAVRSDGMFSGRRFYPKLLQISGSIAPGNSGAPILNTRGEVIGMVVAVPVFDWNGGSSAFSFMRIPPGGPKSGSDTSPTPGRNQGTGQDSGRGKKRNDSSQGSLPRPTATTAGYAVPINYAKPIIADLQAGKPAQHCWIGISVSAHVKPDYKEQTLDLLRTVTVNGLYPDSPALKAGVLKGDEVISINGRPIHEDVDVRIVSQLSRLGDKITFVVSRATGGKSETITLHADAELRPTKAPEPLPADKRPASP